MRLIDIEAHYITRQYLDYLSSRQELPRLERDDGRSVIRWEPSAPEVWTRVSDVLIEALLSIGQERVDLMSDAGIDMSVASLTAPGVEQFSAEDAIPVAQAANDALAEVLREHPGRFIGLASLPCATPEAAADELERCVEMGFRGANIYSHIHELYLDDRRFRPIFERAVHLGVPINLHPMVPHGQMIKPFLGYGWALPGPGLGFGLETAVHAMRLIYSGLFDELPELRMILGHLGESLTFWIYRIDFDFTKTWLDPAHRPQIAKRPSEYLRENFYMTMSGNFLDSAFVSVLMEMGAERIMFATDYPYEVLDEAVEFFVNAPASDEEKRKIGHLNAEKLFGLEHLVE